MSSNYSSILDARTPASGVSLLEICAGMFILGLIAGVFMPLVFNLMAAQRANRALDELRTLYTGIVGDPRANTFGYLGDVGEYPSKLLDLISPSPIPPGWNGPYVTGLRSMENGVLYDGYGGAIEYFRPDSPAVPAAEVDQLALISKGPDRESTNTSSTPNQSATFTGVFPSDPSYGNAITNNDNVVYPKFTDSPGLVRYQSVGQVVFNIRNFDDNDGVQAFVPACAQLYEIQISSVPRGSNEAYLIYSPGGAIVDLLQGQYRVKVLLSGSHASVWEEEIAVRPGIAMARDPSFPGVNSSLFPAITLTVVNNRASAVVVYEYGNPIPSAILSGDTSTRTVHACSRISVKDAITSETIDTFIMPYTAYSKRYSAGAPVFANLTVTNDGPNNAVTVYDDGRLTGVVGRRGNQRVKVYSLAVGDTITVKNENNALLETFSLASATTKNY
jgi:hypothetical protein